MEFTNKIVRIFLTLFIIVGFDIHAGSIIPITRMQEAKSSLEAADEDTLVIFDVDRTLVLMGDQLLNAGKSGFKKRIKKYPAYHLLTEDEQDTLLSIVLLKTSHELIEQDSAEFIERLQKNGIKTIVCTTLETGEFGRIPSMEQWRVDSLNHLGLNFKNAFPELVEIQFYPGVPRTPVFKEGALIASKRTKGEVVKLFLQRLDWQPKKIIMLDDQLSALESVIEELDGQSIDFLGFHYNYVEGLLNNQILNDDLIDLQLRYLLENKIWLTDDEGLSLMSPN